MAVLAVLDKCLSYVTMCIFPAYQRCNYFSCHLIIVDLKCREDSRVLEKYKLSLSFCASTLWKVLTILCTRDILSVEYHMCLLFCTSEDTQTIQIHTHSDMYILHINQHREEGSQLRFSQFSLWKILPYVLWSGS